MFNSNYQVRESYQKTNQYTEEDLEAITGKLESMDRLLKEDSIDFYLVLPPLKHSVYPELLPDNLRKNKGKNRREQLLEYLKSNSGLKLIDPFELLKGIKDTARVYYKNDTHWNQLAAFYVYREIVLKIQEDHSEITPLNISDYDMEIKTSTNGDLVDLLNINGVFTREAYHLYPKYARKTGDARLGATLGTEQSFIYSEADSCEGKRLLMYRDSFGEYLRRHLSENFCYSAFVWDHRLNPERIKKENPDIVILEIMERFMERFEP